MGGCNVILSSRSFSHASARVGQYHCDRKVRFCNSRSAPEPFLKLIGMQLIRYSITDSNCNAESRCASAATSMRSHKPQQQFACLRLSVCGGRSSTEGGNCPRRNRVSTEQPSQLDATRLYLYPRRSEHRKFACRPAKKIRYFTVP